MRIWIFAVLLLTGLSVTLEQTAMAGARRGWRRRAPAGYRARAAYPAAEVRTRAYTPYERYWMDAYPKYYGAIHARSIHTLGIPPGDVGLRGMPW